MEKEKRYTLGEEIFNSVSHGVGICFAVAGCSVLMVLAYVYGDMWGFFSSLIYGITMFLLYLSSTLYHSITSEKAKEIFRIFDHCSIYLLIAGTYTPFTLVTLRDSVGWLLFIGLWVSAIIGIILTAIDIKKFEKVSLGIYLIMGWAVVIGIKPLIEALSLPGMLLLLAGGLMYTFGVIFYKMKKHRYMHSIWHLFVLGGTVFHYFAILFYVIL